MVQGVFDCLRWLSGHDKKDTAQLDAVNLGMGNPDGATPRALVSKLIEAART